MARKNSDPKKAARKKAAREKAARKIRKQSRELDEHPRGLWIDSEILRRMKGRDGHRGTDSLPDTERYLYYAALALDGHKGRPGLHSLDGHKRGSGVHSPGVHSKDKPVKDAKPKAKRTDNKT